MRVSSFLLLLISTTSNAYNLPLNCAPNSGKMTTPTFGTTNAIFTVCAEKVIQSSPSPIYDILLDFPLYPAWNTFVVSVDVPSTVLTAEDVYVGMPMTFHAAGLLPGINSTSNERITHLGPDIEPLFNAWRFDPGDVVGLAVQAEHVNLLLDLGDGTTRYVSWETYYGVGALALAVLKGSLQTQFEVQAEDLKERVESLGS